MGCHSRIVWNIEREWFGWRAHVVFSDGTIRGGDYKTSVALDCWFWKHSTAEEKVRKAIEHVLYSENLWRVSEGGQSPVANNYTVTPEIKLITPREKHAEFGL